MKERILAYLKSRDGFVSGQAISEELGVSRTAIWKYINALKKEGYEIESVTRKGYRLLQSPDIITKEELAAFLPEGIFPGGICCFPVVDSTNEAAKRAVASGASDRTLFAADQQTAGRGRRGRSWSSPAGEDIFFSILLRPDIRPESASMVTILAAIAAAAAAKKHSGQTCMIKWPNDIVMHGRKICGILTEMTVEMDEISSVIVGVGFNVNRLRFPEEIADFASSIRKETGRRVRRAELLSDFAVEFSRRYERFLKEESLAPFVDEYNRCLINAGRQVKILRKGEELIRTAIGINDRGELIVRDEEGTEETVLSGEVSVRGLYGYT